jgi:hypothetical protein
MYEQTELKSIEFVALRGRVVIPCISQFREPSKGNVACSSGAKLFNIS